MKIVFLDMDGVLCTHRACIAVGDRGIFSYLDPIACLLLKRLLDKTGAKLVISSTWRNFHTLEGFQAILSAACPGLGTYILYNEDMWRTDDDGPRRGNEIARWLEKRNDIEEYVILDDDSDMEHLIGRLVKCPGHDGFSFQNYLDALAMLGGSTSSK